MSIARLPHIFGAHQVHRAVLRKFTSHKNIEWSYGFQVWWKSIKIAEQRPLQESKLVLNVVCTFSPDTLPIYAPAGQRAELWRMGDLWDSA